jgi:hypothetical protein
MGTRILWVIESEAIGVTLWQTTYVYFVHVLKLCGRLSLKVIDEFIWQRKYASGTS